MKNSHPSRYDQAAVLGSASTAAALFFAPTAILRFQIRQRLRKLRNEDKEIMWEGVENIEKDELRNDLRNRGLPTAGASSDQMRETLSNWLQLSQKKELPYTLVGGSTT